MKSSNLNTVSRVQHVVMLGLKSKDKDFKPDVKLIARDKADAERYAAKYNAEMDKRNRRKYRYFASTQIVEAGTEFSIS